MKALTGAVGIRRPERLHGAEDRRVWLGLGLGALLLLVPMAPNGVTIVVLGAIVATLAIAARWRVAPLALGVLLVSGLAVRLGTPDRLGSDVLTVTAAAIERALAGQNPYGVGYPESTPPGSPYPYGPLGLLVYLPLGSQGRLLELFAASVVLTVLALRGRLLGLAIYATAPVLITTARDGSNDTTAGLLLLAAFAVARSRPAIGVVILALAVGFKPYVAAWVPAFLVWGGWSVVVPFLIASLVVWAPVLVWWGIPSFLTSVAMAEAVPQVPAWSLASVYRDVRHEVPSPGAFDTLRVFLGGLAAVLSARIARSLDAVILGGTLVFLVTLFTGFWATYAYLAAIAPVLCWRLDDWLAPAAEVEPA